MSASLPGVPSPAERLRERIQREGPIPFAAFMEEALYGPGGYYNRTDLAIGEAGDFVTGSSFSTLFARATHRLLRRLDTVVGRPAALFEAGYGTGAHLAAVAAEAGGARRLLGWDRVPRPLPAGLEAVADLDRVPDGSVAGMVFAYELFDALPVHRLIGRSDGSVGELWVALDRGERFAWSEEALSDPALADLACGCALSPGQIADLTPGWAALARRLAAKLERGLLIVCDYGFERPQLLDPRIRRHGTLACYRRHRVHRDPFVAVGEQDLTAHVDFTAIREAGEAAGLTTFAFTHQALWLLASDVFEDLRDAPPATRAQARTLLDPGGMGEEIRVLVQGRSIDAAEVLSLDLLLARRPESS